MVKKPLQVLVVDDDFMIARVHAKYIDSQKGYRVMGVSHNFEQSMALVHELQPDLLVLDVYLPDRSGIELLRTIRSQGISCDVILITASKELEVVEEGFRLGIFDYLLKPFDLEHLKESLVKYQQYKIRLGTSLNLNQAMVDDLKKIRSTGPLKQLQSGIDVRTLEHIKESLHNTKGFYSADQIAQLTEVSRSTARMYLAYLVEEKVVEEKLQYGTVGRPQLLYRMINNITPLKW
ncbi:Transcriptional regulatory protein CitB, DpiA [Desulfosporosinus sp. I2]|uniref:response regulator n=1 Tax=Desulfosporosinus sp. I2 TaxID=1617025 RepID=UPI0005EF88B5|nr:response regulator [Desulfosporosinus sp. I2]KJR46581.1 Transcriptional regulatory protein CitB, DpiA [Desulfosporosinus sp. I2]